RADVMGRVCPVEPNGLDRAHWRLAARAVGLRRYRLRGTLKAITRLSATQKYSGEEAAMRKASAMGRARLTRRQLVAGAAASVVMPAIGASAQATVIRWGESLPNSHPQVQMAERIAKEAREKSGGRIDVQIFPNSQLGSN